MSLEKLEERYSKYEIARILGARALQLAMDAPVLLKLDKEKLEELNFDVLKIAEMEFEQEVLPITVKRPFPRKTEEKIKKMSKKELEESGALKGPVKAQAPGDKKIEEIENEEEKDIAEEGEIMELANPNDELEEEEVVEEGV